ncbi:hypothetical protein G6M89_13075 [Natronolimnobius sp. AArcel1]|uniref:DR2241 family protein n=1 Tax=Natronolimnobius sp. AArcel1 TaxID=1679093 RepID=UPI0013ECE810|nr:DR2241 family protein [Natronolimnobius sp. AArcel1]NGM69932.1 hypothetical protein [Natronolimnobius sp. AArcel1]
MTALETAVDALLERAEDNSVTFDGLRLGSDGDAYTLSTPTIERDGLEADALRDVLTGLDDLEPYVRNWYHWQVRVGAKGTARRAFLRWCERAPLSADEMQVADPVDESPTLPKRNAALETGIDREWGQLAITARFLDTTEPTGERVYDCWHVEDADTALEALEVYDEPSDAREIATNDEDGRYRPLKTAPTLRSGWAFTGLSGRELVDTIGFIYPATIANWHREQRGNLDVDHWVDTAERQTGIYDVIDDLPREAVDWLAEACCVDSQCLRRREWEYEAGDDLEPAGGDGPFPCREPCSLVVAAARKWAILESETEKTYELELTTSEYNQLADLIDAVADGRVDDIREADVNDGANRYRARYLRAKRFDDEGGLDARERSE